MKKSFLDLNKESMETTGFWTEEYKTILINNTECMYNTEIIREWGISDIVMNGDKVLLKWYKRHRFLTEDELKNKYGR
jgi:hypothetical protein